MLLLPDRVLGRSRRGECSKFSIKDMTQEVHVQSNGKFVRKGEKPTRGHEKKYKHRNILKHFLNNRPRQYFPKLHFSLKYIFNIPGLLET